MFSRNPNNHKNPGYNVGDTLGWKWKIGEMVNQQMNSSSVIETLKMIIVKAETLTEFKCLMLQFTYICEGFSYQYKF